MKNSSQTKEVYSIFNNEIKSYFDEMFFMFKNKVPYNIYILGSTLYEAVFKRIISGISLRAGERQYNSLFKWRRESCSTIVKHESLYTGTSIDKKDNKIYVGHFPEKFIKSNIKMIPVSNLTFVPVGDNYVIDNIVHLGVSEKENALKLLDQFICYNEIIFSQVKKDYIDIIISNKNPLKEGFINKVYQYSLIKLHFNKEEDEFLSLFRYRSLNAIYNLQDETVVFSDVFIEDLYKKQFVFLTFQNKKYFISLNHLFLDKNNILRKSIDYVEEEKTHTTHHKQKLLSKRDNLFKFIDL